MRRYGFLNRVGPGLVTGAADDDPSGIGTYCQVGAQFGFQLLWVTLLTIPLMTAIQTVSARIGRVTGRGVAGALQRSSPSWLLFTLVGLLIVANVINIAADLAAMGACAKMVFGGPQGVYVISLGLASLALQVFVPYHRYVQYLKGLTTALLAYVATAFALHIPWREALHATFVPTFSRSKDYWLALIALLGTTLSPYLLFWQASEEVEDLHDHKAEKPLKAAPGQAPEQLGRIAFDTTAGMAFSNLIAWFIILTAAATLHHSGLSEITGAEQAAGALKPLAGRFAFLLFALGVVGTGLLAIPVLAGSAAYALGEALRWPVGLERKPKEARGFYGVLAGATLIGLTLTFIHINPIKALYWTAVINGIAAVPLMGALMVISCNHRIMGEFTLSLPLRWLGWITAAVMAFATVGLFVSWGFSS